MASTILIAGATGNTGRSLVETLPALLKSSKVLCSHRVVALTRSLSNPVAQHLAKIPGVEVIEQNWVEITADWLREHKVARVFVASHIQPNAFAEESQFYVNALNAGVKYVVRISTTAGNVRADCLPYYARTHWAIETLLSQPEFNDLHWTSLQPNAFTQMIVGPVAEFIREFRRTGKQGTISLTIDARTPFGPIDAGEVGVVAAHLLSQENTTPHNKRRYVLNGPEDITGEEIVNLAETYIGTTVEKVQYKDTSFFDQQAAAQTTESKNLILSFKHAPEVYWKGEARASTTSEEVIRLAAPKRSAGDVLPDLLKD